METDRDEAFWDTSPTQLLSYPVGTRSLKQRRKEKGKRRLHTRHPPLLPQGHAPATCPGRVKYFSFQSDQGQELEANYLKGPLSDELPPVSR